MIIKPLLILQGVLLLGLGAVFLVPRQVGIKPAGVLLALPAEAGGWIGQDEAVSDAEKVALGPDTEFARKIYKDANGDQVYVSIVLSGQDMNTSIHRPERCLPAQGWTIADSSTIGVPMEGSDPSNPNRTIDATRLYNVRYVQRKTGDRFAVYSLEYYWFIGSKDVTPSHFERTMIDWRDRLLKGYTQRWAYVTFAAMTGPSQSRTDELLQSVIRQIIPRIEAHQG
jgi:EpsI family protein